MVTTKEELKAFLTKAEKKGYLYKGEEIPSLAKISSGFLPFFFNVKDNKTFDVKKENTFDKLRVFKSNGNEGIVFLPDLLGCKEDTWYRLEKSDYTRKIFNLDKMSSNKENLKNKFHSDTFSFKWGRGGTMDTRQLYATLKEMKEAKKSLDQI